MEKLQHLWNLVTRLPTSAGIEVSHLQTHYVECCRQLMSTAQLPAKIFGPGTMCSYCGVLWARVHPKVRLMSGQTPSKSVKKMMQRATGKEKKLRRVRDTLVNKSVKNIGNGLIIRCSLCSKDTKLNFTKPIRQKLQPVCNLDHDEQTPVIKKRKKRTKDKTAGLTINGVANTTPKNIKTPKVKPTNLNKLGAMVNKNITPSRNSSLHDFIMELG